MVRLVPHPDGVEARRCPELAAVLPAELRRVTAAGVAATRNECPRTAGVTVHEARRHYAGAGEVAHYPVLSFDMPDRVACPRRFRVEQAWQVGRLSHSS
jgi:hypothetical protein